MPRRVSDFRGLADFSRVKVLGAIQEQPERTLRELAVAVGLHVNTVRDHTRVLEDEGLIRSRTRASGGRGRPSLVYSPVVDPTTNAAAARRVRQVRERGEHVRRSLRSNGSDSSATDADLQLDTLYEHLDDTGLTPRIVDDALQIELVPCPAFRYVTTDLDQGCAVHAQLLRDVLAQVPGPLRLQELEPFVTPETCRVRLAGPAHAE